MSEISAYHDGYTLGKESMRTAAFEWGLESGQALERERIIKLLEDWQNSVMGENNTLPLTFSVAAVIALIKGENK